MPINSKSLSSALIPTGKRKEDLVEEKIDETILSLLGLTDVFDFTYEEYLSLLKEKMTAQRMQGGGDSEEAQLITNEYKRVKGKTGRFKVKAKKVNVNRVVSKEKAQSVRKRSKVRLNLPKFLPRSEDTAPTSTPIVVSSSGENQQDNSGILNFLKNDLMSALQSINVLVSDILDNLKEQKVIDNKKAEQDRKLAEIDKKKKREEGLEKKAEAKETNALVDKIKKPFTDIFDAIQNFIMMVAAGVAINFLLKVLKNPAILIKPLVDFVNSIIDFLNGIITWIFNLIITPLNGAINSINSGLQGFIDQINNALNVIPNVTNPIPSLPQIPTIDPMDPNKGLIPQVPMPQWAQQGQQQGQQGSQQLAEGGTVYGPGGIDNVNVKLTAGESVLQVGARERQIQATGIDPLAFNVGPNANKPTFKDGLPGFFNGGEFLNFATKGLGNATKGLGNFFGGGTEHKEGTPQPEAPPPSPPVNHNLAIAKAAQKLRMERQGQGRSSYLEETNYGRDGCVWAVNQVYKEAGLTPPWGDSLWVPKAEEMMIKHGYQQILQKDRRPGDIMVNHDDKSPPQAHIGVVLDDEGLNVISNSSGRRAFSRVSTPKEYNDSYGRPGKFWRRPNPKKRRKSGLQGATQSVQKTTAQVAIKQTGTSLSRDISPSSGAGDISFLPLPLDQGAQGETSFASPNPTPQVAFSAHDPNAIFTANTYGTFG